MKFLVCALVLCLVLNAESCPWFKQKCGDVCCPFGSYCINKKTGNCCYGICSNIVGNNKTDPPSNRAERLPGV